MTDDDRILASGSGPEERGRVSGAEPADRVRGFPAFAASRRRGARGRTWWANAWIDALEDTSLDARPLRRGRSIASAGRVGPITVSPGRVATTVSDPDGAPHRTVVHVDPLTGAQWDRFDDRVAGHAGHLAALLDHDMPRELADAAGDADVWLLPGIGELEPECDCDGWELPCEHAAALCYQTGWLLDADPFVLLLLRGRGERELLAELHRRNTGLAATEPDTEPAAGAPSGVAARDAYAAPVGAPPPLDDLPDGPATPAFTPSAAPGIDPDALLLLAADAAARARTLLTGPAPVPAGHGADAPPDGVWPSEVWPSEVWPADAWTDTVRLAAAHPGDARLRAGLDRACGDPVRLDRAVAAWRLAGAAGLDTLEHPWTPRAATPGWRTGLARAADALGRARRDGAEDSGAPVTRRNHWTAGDIQLRFGRDHRWHPYRRHDGVWWPAGPPQADAATALPV